MVGTSVNIIFLKRLYPKRLQVFSFFLSLLVAISGSHNCKIINVFADRAALTHLIFKEHGSRRVCKEYTSRRVSTSDDNP